MIADILMGSLARRCHRRRRCHRHRRRHCRHRRFLDVNLIVIHRELSTIDFIRDAAIVFAIHTCHQQLYCHEIIFKLVAKDG